MQVLWIEHVQAMAAAMEALDKFASELNNLPGDAEIRCEVKVDVTLYGEPTGWSLVAEDDTYYWRIEEEDDDE